MTRPDTTTSPRLAYAGIGARRTPPSVLSDMVDGLLEGRGEGGRRNEEAAPLQGEPSGAEPARKPAAAPGTRPLRTAHRPRWGEWRVGRRQAWDVSLRRLAAAASSSGPNTTMRPAVRAASA